MQNALQPAGQPHQRHHAHHRTTAIFLPLNLMAGIFGMNFEFIPLVHKNNGFWWALGAMSLIAVALVLVFWRKRYLARTGN